MIRIIGRSRIESYHFCFGYASRCAAHMTLIPIYARIIAVIIESFLEVREMFPALLIPESTVRVVCPEYRYVDTTCR